MRTLFGDRPGRPAKFFGMALLLAAGIAVVGVLVMLLWNWLIPALFAGGRHIDYWQALGLLLLARLLLGRGLGRGGHGRWSARRGHWDSLTAEEKERLRRRFKSRWGGRWGTQSDAGHAEVGQEGESK